jgi:hypothetical protein
MEIISADLDPVSDGEVTIVADEGEAPKLFGVACVFFLH